MRHKKSREVNIFSASVVDLFASGLGVFLIVAIIALVNQKKENSKSTPNKKAEAQNQKVIKGLETKLSVLSKKMMKKEEENMVLRSQGVSDKEKALVEKIKIQSQIEKSQLEDQYQEIVDKQEKKIKELITKYERSQDKVNDLKSNLSSLKQFYTESQNKKPDVSAINLKESSFKVGSKIKLHNVQFYAGTIKTIEPYASAEIRALGQMLLEHPSMKVEVSGHIFLSKEEIEKRKEFDSMNLSGRRANVVCSLLIEMGISKDRLKCVGYGGKRYLYLTNDEYSREAQLNRRVEVEILSK